jgi:hypothetical protein
MHPRIVHTVIVVDSEYFPRNTEPAGKRFSLDFRMQIMTRKVQLPGWQPVAAACGVKWRHNSPIHPDIAMSDMRLLAYIERVPCY